MDPPAPSKKRKITQPTLTLQINPQVVLVILTIRAQQQPQQQQWERYQSLRSIPRQAMHFRHLPLAKQSAAANPSGLRMRNGDGYIMLLMMTVSCALRVHRQMHENCWSRIHDVMKPLSVLDSPIAKRQLKDFYSMKRQTAMQKLYRSLLHKIRSLSMPCSVNNVRRSSILHKRHCGLFFHLYDI